MRPVLLLLLGAHLAYAGTHSLRYFYTAVSGDIDFPEYTAVGLVDGGQFYYFDNNIMKAVPKTEWIRQNVGADYWNRETQNMIGTHQSFKNNIKVAMERFNQSTGVHTNQVMYGCEWDDETGTANGFEQHGFDGQDFISLDLKEMRWVTSVQQGFITTQKYNSNRAQIEYDKQYYTTDCIEWLKKYLQYGKSSLEKTVSPQVSLLHKKPSALMCHATGFYPSRVTITWMKNDQEHHEDVEVGELLPNEDGTFQKTSTITVAPDEWKNNKYSCVVEHEDKIRIYNDNTEDSALVAIIVGVLVAVVVLAALGFIGYKVFKKLRGFKPVNTSEESSETSSQTAKDLRSQP